MSDRKMASIRKVMEIKPIDGADKICAYRVDGWWVVDSINKYQVNDLVVYLEVDSWVPNELAPFLTRGTEPREYNGVKGERLRTVKLRGQISQGLLLPLEPTCKNIESLLFEDLDVSVPLNVQKWERPIPAQLAGQVRGNFPALVPKTDQERIQNLSKQFDKFMEDTWSVTEKLDGSSCTFYLDDEDQFHVCSRNLDLKEDENNSFWKTAKKYDVEGIMRRNNMRGMAIQGEMIGEGIQGNQYKVVLDFYVYDMYNTRTGEYILPSQLKAACERHGLNHVPILAEGVTLVGSSIQSILSEAEGKSRLNGSEREGIVFKSEKVHHRSFKAISNKWLLKTGE